MKKNIFTLLFALMASVGTMFAEKVKINGLYYNLDAETHTAEVTYESCSKDNVYYNTGWTIVSAEIPESVNYNSETYSVTSIGNDAFSDCKGLTSVTIGNNVTSIGEDAFFSCSGLTSIEIPNSVTSIGDYAFRECTGLTSVTFGKSVTSIGNYVFYNCSPTSVVWNAKNCSGMTFRNVKSITFGNEVEVIPSSICSGNTKLTSITIPNSVTSIGDEAFSGCTRLTSVTIGNSVTSIGKAAFDKCTGLTSVVWNAKNCNGYNFGSQVKSFTFGNEVEVIPSSICSRNTKLTSITIPNSVTSIGSYAFTGCSSLTSVTMGNSVTSIGEDAFNECSSLTRVDIADLAAWSSINFHNPSSNPLYYAEHLYLNDSEITELIIPNSVTSIGNYAFSYCKSMTSVTIPSSVTSIGKRAFFDCIGLTSVTIGNNVTSIGDGAFCYCRGLISIEIPNSVTNIGNYAFRDCGLTSVTIPNSVTSIGAWAFDRCNSLTSIEIPNSVTSIGNGAFFGCRGLNSIEIPNNVTNIGDSTFYYCSGLTSVTIPKSVTSIGSYAFSGCTGLTSIEIPNSVTSIGDRALEKCSNLTSVTIPNSVTSIGDYAFKGCAGLTSVTIPNNVTSVGDRAFENCSNLMSVTWNARNCYCKNRVFSAASITSFSFGNEVKKIPACICLGMGRLTSIFIPNSVTEIGNSAFWDCVGLNTISLGENITTYGENAFGGCDRIASIYNYREKPAKIDTNTFPDVDYFDCKLYVLAGSVDMYKSAGSNWKDFFFNIEPIEAVTTQTDVVKVEPSETTAVVAWPSVSGAYTYDLVIKDKKGNPICTLTFNANGQLTSIAFHAPTRNKSQQQTQVAGFSFTVTGLDAGTTYDLTITAKDNNGKTIDKKELSFTTAGSPEALNQISQEPKANSQKVLINGQLLILRGDKTYTLTGQEVR